MQVGLSVDGSAEGDLVGMIDGESVVGQTLGSIFHKENVSIVIAYQNSFFRINHSVYISFQKCQVAHF